ncbi:MAG: hypothetical protein LBH43_18890 [Treponema sp.]|jgi:hypothetical protein|nr:hypothetical protein [Treponema sp.]
MMKSKNIFLFVLVLAAFCITGCGTTAVPYSFAANESENGTASITFIGNRKIGVDLHYFEEVELPLPEKKRSYWAPVIFPAGRPFSLRVNIYNDQIEIGAERVFECPALTAGVNYKLEYKPNKTFLGMTVKGARLILTEEKRKTAVFEQQVKI